MHYTYLVLLLFQCRENNIQKLNYISHTSIIILRVKLNT